VSPAILKGNLKIFAENSGPVARCGYTYEELAQLKIEREIRISYIVEAKKSRDICRGVQDLGSQATKISQRLGTRYYDSHAKPGDTEDGIPASGPATQPIAFVTSTSSFSA